VDFYSADIETLIFGWNILYVVRLVTSKEKFSVPLRRCLPMGDDRESYG
jgi:hypothetical protein